MNRVSWTPLNSGEPTHASYRSGEQTAPDVAACSASLTRRGSWTLGRDQGSDHPPMLLEVRGSGDRAPVKTKTKWSFANADWRSFEESCEAAFEEAEPEHLSVQERATRFTATLVRAGAEFVPRGTRRNAKPWALDPAL